MAQIHSTGADINECLLRNGHGPCQDVCINEFASYKCSCEGLPGTRLSSDLHNCEDAGECAKNNGGCSHICLTNLGRMFCLCPEGFMLGDDWKTCKGNKLVVLHLKSPPINVTHTNIHAQNSIINKRDCITYMNVCGKRICPVFCLEVTRKLKLAHP